MKAVRMICVAAVMLGVLSWAAADDPPCYFYPTKDFGSGCDMANDNHVSTGANYAVRCDTFCSGWYADFDRDALRSYVGGLDLSHFKITFSFVPRSGGSALDSSWYWLASWHTLSDWDEGDGQVAISTWNMAGAWYGWGTHKYNWTKETGEPPAPNGAATKWYANTYYTDTDGAPNTGDEVVDAVNSQPWILPDGTVIPSIFPGWDHDDPHGFEEFWFDGCHTLNQTPAHPANPPAGQPWTRYEMPVDDAVMNDLLGDVATTKCRGVWVKAFNEAMDPRVEDSGGHINLWLFTREGGAVNDLNGAAGPTDIFDYRPCLKVVLRGDADENGCVDYVDLGVLATNYDATPPQTWGQGDFNEDGTVDYVDLGLLATNYDLGQCGSGAGIPEPGALSLLALAGVGVLRRRRRRQPPAGSRERV